jgi:hypothetical protein
MPWKTCLFIFISPFNEPTERRSDETHRWIATFRRTAVTMCINYINCWYQGIQFQIEAVSCNGYCSFIEQISMMPYVYPREHGLNTYYVQTCFSLIPCVFWFICWKCLVKSQRRRVVNVQNICFYTSLQMEAASFSEILLLINKSTRYHIPKTRIFINITVRMQILEVTKIVHSRST